MMDEALPGEVVLVGCDRCKGEGWETGPIPSSRSWHWPCPKCKGKGYLVVEKAIYLIELRYNRLMAARPETWTEDDRAFVAHLRQPT